MKNTDMQDALKRLYELERLELHSTVSETGISSSLTLEIAENIKGVVTKMESRKSHLPFPMVISNSPFFSTQNMGIILIVCWKGRKVVQLNIFPYLVSNHSP